ncbi:hypothetical protein GQ55_5G046500 [Panicum hallii var. hallii]|uniref:Uncharacterized protein n=1 Tax=Panicum hallii var. hallii TaxID=1504633 RepID=A0A2T7DCP4_9POAL|nr:hypothetical protein GQ55_5G046500 [Panicum hallii var. hallii]
METRRSRRKWKSIRRKEPLNPLGPAQPMLEPHLAPRIVGIRAANGEALGVGPFDERPASPSCRRPSLRRHRVGYARHGATGGGPFDERPATASCRRRRCGATAWAMLATAPLLGARVLSAWGRGSDMLAIGAGAREESLRRRSAVMGKMPGRRREDGRVAAGASAFFSP